MEPVIHAATSDGEFRFAAPGRPSWQQTGRQWRPIRRRRVVQLLTQPATRARAVLIERGRPGREAATLADLEPDRLDALLRWIGWPDLDPTQTDVPITVAGRLRARSNDYWILDATLAALTDRHGGLPPLPGISIVIPARDVHNTVQEVVDAVTTAARELPAGTGWECLVVDDRSEPPLTLEARTSSRARVVRAKQRVYCGGARNLGLAHARYPVIVFVDGDTLLSPNYLVAHARRHLVMPNLLTVSLREQLPAGAPMPLREPDGSGDTRVQAHYAPGRLGLVPVTRPVTVRALDQTRAFRDFGYARHLGPADLPFMVKGNNLAGTAAVARVGFPPDFVGYGPEDGTFAAKVIARGAFVVPLGEAGVFHRSHPPRSGSFEARDAELRANLDRQARHLHAPAEGPWPTTGSPIARVAP